MATVRKRKWTHNGVDREAWIVAYTDHVGRRRLKTCESRSAAETLKARITREVKHGRIPFTAGASVQQASELYLRRQELRMRDGDIGRQAYDTKCATVDKWIAPTIGKAKLDAVRPLFVQEWVDNLRAQKALPSTIHRAVNVLQAVIGEAMRLEFVSRNFVKDVPPILPRIKSPGRLVPNLDQVRMLLAACDPETPIGICVELAIYTGMRIGELSALRWDNVLLDAGIIRVREAIGERGVVKGPKTEAGIRDIPIPPRAILRLQHWRDHSEKDSKGLVFYDSKSRKTGARYRPILRPWRSAYRAHWLDLQVKAGLSQQFAFHSLRHVASSLFIEQRLTPKRVQKIMGHAKADITFNRYGHVLFEDGSSAQAAANIEQLLLGGGT